MDREMQEPMAQPRNRPLPPHQNIADVSRCAGVMLRYG
jgi:hypothetical protein